MKYDEFYDDGTNKYVERKYFELHTKNATHDLSYHVTSTSFSDYISNTIINNLRNTTIDDINNEWSTRVENTVRYQPIPTTTSIS